MEPAFKRILLKLSGEVLAGEQKTGIDFSMVETVCKRIKTVVENGVQVGIVIGGGNFWRGRSSGNMDRNTADSMGMLATVINCLGVSDTLIQMGVKASVMSAVEMNKIADFFTAREAKKRLEAGEVVLFAAGTGSPFFSTDTGAALRAAEIDADAILLAKNIDGVYDADPAKVPTAKKFDRISYAEVLARNLKVMDTTATALAMDTRMPVLVFALKDPANIKRVLMGEQIGTYVGFDE